MSHPRWDHCECKGWTPGAQRQAAAIIHPSFSIMSALAISAVTRDLLQGNHAPFLLVSIQLCPCSPVAWVAQDSWVAQERGAEQVLACPPGEHGKPALLALSSRASRRGRGWRQGRLVALTLRIT